MKTPDDNPPHAPINAKLADAIATLPTPPAWHDAWMRLEPDTPEEERLRVYQAIRDSGVLPKDAGFYLVCWQIDAMASQEAEISLRDMDDRLKAIEQAYEREHGEPWPPDEAPPEYEELLEQYHVAWDRIFLVKLEAFGELAMADLYRGDPEAFDERSDVGRQYFHGADEPEEWLDDLVEAVAGNMTDEGGAGALGYRCREEDGLWEVLIYAKPVELLGGADDGEIVAPGFSLDLEGLRSLFDRVEDFSWYALGLNDSEGPRVSIEGVYQGHEVFLQVLAYAPDDEEPGMKVWASRRKP